MLPNAFDRFRLPNRTALVTGARREIGRAIALALAGAGEEVLTFACLERKGALEHALDTFPAIRVHL